MSDGDFLIDALCRAAFVPQAMTQWNGSQQMIVEQPSPLVTMLASMLQKAISEDTHLRQLILAELTKPENLKSLVGELAKGVGGMRVDAGYGYGGNRMEVPGWVNEALTASLVEWLGSDAGAELIPKMLKNSDIKITVERKDAK